MAGYISGIAATWPTGQPSKAGVIAYQALQTSATMLPSNLMVRRARQLLLVLIAFAFIGGASPQLAHSAGYGAPMTMTGIPCDMMVSHAGMQADKPPAPSSGSPCKGVTPDCIKQMGCVTDAVLPARMVNFGIAAQFSDVDYWSAWSKLADFVREPEPLPPRTV
jgi:hypothetical protein